MYTIGYVDADIAPLAAAYARATEAHLRQCSTLDFRDAGTIIHRYDRLTGDVLSAAADQGVSVLPIPTDRHEAVELLAARASALLGPLADEPTRLDIVTDGPFDSLITPGGHGRAFGARADAIGVAEYLRASTHEVLTISGHCDGLDAQIVPGKLTLCPVRDDPRTISGPNRSHLPCIAHGTCYRQGTQVHHRLHPTDLRARVLVFNACSVVATQRHPFSSDFGRLIALSPTIPCVVGRWDIFFTSVVPALQIGDDLIRGLSVSEAVDRYNQNAQVRRLREPFIVIGDGRMRVR